MLGMGISEPEIQYLSVTISNLNSTCPKSLWVSSLVCDKRHWSPFRQGPERWGPSTRKGQKSAEYLVFLGFPQINKSYSRFGMFLKPCE